MKPPMPPREPLPFELPAGAVQACFVRAGSTLLLSHGALQIDGAARWFGGSVWQPRWALHEASTWRAERHGWVSLHAPRGARGVLVPPPPAWRHGPRRWLERLVDRLGAAARALRRRARRTMGGTASSSSSWSRS